ncbi:MAG: hypothetical protein HDR55_06815 [Treponema sp.]|nr:hypothetical protein [Treponema sp.]
MKNKIALFLCTFLCMAALFAVDIETALQQAAERFSATIEKDSIVAIAGISSESAEFSDFMLDELTMDFVQTRTLSVANRTKLDAIKKRMNFQSSSMISEEEAQTLGTAVGANVVVYGVIKRIGSNLNLVVQALNVSDSSLVDMCRLTVEPNATTDSLLLSSEKTSAASKPTRRESKKDEVASERQANTLSPCTSDLQLRPLGFHGVDYTVIRSSSNWGSSYEYKIEHFIPEWCFGLANYNLFNINKVVSIGFFEEISANIWIFGLFGWGFNFVTGPALGITLGKVITFQIAPGLSLGFDFFDAYSGEIGLVVNPVGFNASLVMKFLPASVVSPIIGFYYDMKSGMVTDYDSDLDDWRTIFHSFNVTAGISFNFGRRR